ncbi:MAG: response regulator, partial [Chloroflexi bacterium]|nr:response regulator [Chloroflexota bacterium]
LKMFGFETDYALSGAQALAKTHQNLPDAIVLDLMMPDTDVFEVIRYLHAGTATVGHPIIIVTAIGAPDAEEQSMQAGATAFLRKPVSIHRLGETVRAHLPHSVTGQP